MRLSSWFLVSSLAILAATAPAGAQFRTATVTSALVTNTATIGGSVIPYKEVVLSAQIPGPVVFVAGHEGEKFAAGSPLVKIDDSAIQAQRRGALAQIYNADVGLRNAQVQYQSELFAPKQDQPGMPGMMVPGMFDQMFSRNMSNAVGLGNSRVTRDADLFGRGTSVGSAQGSVLQAQSQLEAIDAKLRDATLSAPFEGVILKKLVEVGDTVQPGQELMRFAHTTYLRIRADVPVRLVQGLSKGQLVIARLDAGGAAVRARVAQIYPMADQAEHTVTVKFDLPRGVAGGPGMYAEVSIPDRSTGAVADLPVIPEDALIWRGSLPNVFVLVDGKASLRVVRPGSVVDDGKITILSGLKVGEQVILNPPADLTSGRQ